MGIVHIIGTGPGDPRLITVRGRDLIARADAIVFDSSVSRALLPADAVAAGHPELFDVGRRRRGAATASQNTINELLVRLARDGKRVARLMGGDPFVFGRGVEEAQALNDASVPFEIVPGITAGVGAAAYAGIPVTHPGLSTSVTFVSGMDLPGNPAARTDWSALAKTGGTVVIYMGSKLLAEITKALIDGGMPPDIPAAVVQRGTRNGQRTLVATLATLDQAVLAGRVAPPSIVVLGWTVILRDELAWFERRPLFGRRLVVAQSLQSSMLGERLRDLGARVLEMPSDGIARLDLAPVRAELPRLAEYGWVIFATEASVTIFWDQLLGSGRDARALAGINVAGVGAESAAALLARGITVDLIPRGFSAEALVEMLGERDDVAGSRILLLAPETSELDLAGELAPLGAEITELQAYRRIPDERGVRRLRRALERDTVSAVVFTSLADARAYLAAAGADLAFRAPAISTGPGLSEAVKEMGFEIAGEASESSVESLLAAVERALS